MFSSKVNNFFLIQVELIHVLFVSLFLKGMLLIWGGVMGGGGTGVVVKSPSYILLGPQQVHVTCSLAFSTTLFTSDFPLLSKHILQNELSHQHF